MFLFARQIFSFFYPFNFTVVPKHLRSLASSIMSLVWLVILSFMAYQPA